jgi:YgiT-type zinc finger domain-containing protein
MHETEATMKWFTCKDGETSPGVATVTLERSGVTLLIRNVPADTCDVCGERYHSEGTTAELRRELESAERVGEDFRCAPVRRNHLAHAEMTGRQCVPVDAGAGTGFHQS